MSLCQRWQMFKPQLNCIANEMFDKCFKIQTIRSCKHDKYTIKIRYLNGGYRKKFTTKLSNVIDNTLLIIKHNCI